MNAGRKEEAKFDAPRETGDLSGMANPENLKAPWLVAAWPGMGGVGITAAYYLMAKLGMHLLTEFPARELFELETIEVNDGLIHAGRLPRSRLFLWRDPEERHDLILFVGEAQPVAKGDAFCEKLIARAQAIGAQRVFTFAAMGTSMELDAESRVFAAAIDRETLQTFERKDLHILRKGTITGLNGVLLGVAAQQGMKGGCLLGEMSDIFPHFPFPKAAVAVLRAFQKMAGIRVDLTELEEESRRIDARLQEILKRVGTASELGEIEERMDPEEEGEEADSEGLSTAEAARIEELFERARRDRSRAYELKQELDRLKVFRQFEDRFLDLFKEP